MRPPPCPTFPPRHHRGWTLPAKSLINKAVDFRKEIKDLSGGIKPPAISLILHKKKFSNDINDLPQEVKPPANPLNSLYYKKLNDFNDLYHTVTVYCKSLILLVYTIL